MMKRVITIALLLTLYILPQSAMANDTTIESVADMFNLDTADEELNRISAEYGLDDFNLKYTALEIVGGQYNFFDVFIKLVHIAIGQAADVLYLMRRIIILILLSAVLEPLSSSFSSGRVSKLGQYICSAVLVITVMQSFSFASSTAVSAVENITKASETLQPLYMLIMTAGGRITKMTAAVPVLYTAAGILNYIVKKIVVPGILFAALITFINSMAEKDMLMELAGLMSCICKWSVRVCAGVFIFAMSLIKIGVPDVAVIAGKSIKTAAEAVPVVGSLMSSAAETAAAITKAMGNSITAAIMVFIIFISIMPVIRLAVIMLIYKLAAALTEPIASKRTIKCISLAADYTGILTGVVFTAEIMFITVTALMLSV